MAELHIRRVKDYMTNGNKIMDNDISFCKASKDERQERNKVVKVTKPGGKEAEVADEHAWIAS